MPHPRFLLARRRREGGSFFEIEMLAPLFFPPHPPARLSSRQPLVSMRRHTLLIDADDTLWENNVFFEKLIEDFISVVEPYGYTRAYIRHILNEIERKNIRQYGYGVRSFGRSLEETYLKLADQMARREILAQIHSRVIELERTPPKILDGVPETLAYLTERHRLILFTKGEPAEQAAKVERSGLQGFFEFIEIVPEKNTQTYGGLVHKPKIA